MDVTGLRALVESHFFTDRKAEAMPYSHQQDDEADTHFTLRANSAPCYTTRRNDSFQKQTHEQKDEADKDSEGHGERVTAKCEDAWPLALAMVGGLYGSPGPLCHLSPRSLLMRQMGNYLQETHLKKAAGSAFTRICMCLNLGGPEVNVC